MGSLAEYFGRFGVQLSDVAVPGAEKEKMTEPTRYLVRKGSTGWMVWDRHTREPARLEEGRLAVWLTEQQAQKIKDELLGLKVNGK
jgi:hypothetical protein